MNRLRLGTLAALLLAFVSARGVASDSLLKTLQPQGYVTDVADVIQPQDEEQIQLLLKDLDQRTGIQIAVVALPSLEGGEITDFSNRLFQRWGIGKKGKDNGVLFIAAMQDRKMRIEVGYGVEPVLTDSKSGQILGRVAKEFRQKKISEGFLLGSQLLCQVVDPNAPAVTLPQVQGQGIPSAIPPTIFLLVVLIFFGALFFFSIFGPSWLRAALWAILFSGGRGGGSGGGFGSGGFGGFGGGSSGGGGSSRSW